MRSYKSSFVCLHTRKLILSINVHLVTVYLSVNVVTKDFNADTQVLIVLESSNPEGMFILHLHVPISSSS